MKIGIYEMNRQKLTVEEIQNLKIASENCDKLIVALNVSNSYTNLFTESVYDIWYKIAALRFVDSIIPFSGDEDLETLIRTTKHDIRFVHLFNAESIVGQQFEERNNVEILLINSFNQTNARRITRSLTK